MLKLFFKCFLFYFFNIKKKKTFTSYSDKSMEDRLEKAGNRGKEISWRLLKRDKMFEDLT